VLYTVSAPRGGKIAFTAYATVRSHALLRSGEISLGGSDTLRLLEGFGHFSYFSALLFGIMFLLRILGGQTFPPHSVNSLLLRRPPSLIPENRVGVTLATWLIFGVVQSKANQDVHGQVSTHHRQPGGTCVVAVLELYLRAFLWGAKPVDSLFTVPGLPTLSAIVLSRVIKATAVASQQALQLCNIEDDLLAITIAKVVKACASAGSGGPARFVYGVMGLSGGGNVPGLLRFSLPVKGSVWSLPLGLLGGGNVPGLLCFSLPVKGSVWSLPSGRSSGGHAPGMLFFSLPAKGPPVRFLSSPLTNLSNFDLSSLILAEQGPAKRSGAWSLSMSKFGGQKSNSLGHQFPPKELANRFKVRFAVGIGWPKKFRPAGKFVLDSSLRGAFEETTFHCRGLLLPFSQPSLFRQSQIAVSRSHNPSSLLLLFTVHCCVWVFQAGATSRGYFAFPSPSRGPSGRFP